MAYIPITDFETTNGQIITQALMRKYRDNLDAICIDDVSIPLANTLKRMGRQNSIIVGATDPGGSALLRVGGNVLVSGSSEFSGNVSIKAPMSWPSANASGFLKNDAAGALSWETPGSSNSWTRTVITSEQLIALGHNIDAPILIMNVPANKFIDEAAICLTSIFQGGTITGLNCTLGTSNVGSTTNAGLPIVDVRDSAKVNILYRGNDNYMLSNWKRAAITPIYAYFFAGAYMDTNLIPGGSVEISFKLSDF